MPCFKRYGALINSAKRRRSGLSLKNNFRTWFRRSNNGSKWSASTLNYLTFIKHQIYVTQSALKPPQKLGSLSTMPTSPSWKIPSWAIHQWTIMEPRSGSHLCTLLTFSHFSLLLRLRRCQLQQTTTFRLKLKNWMTSHILLARIKIWEKSKEKGKFYRLKSLILPQWEITISLLHTDFKMIIATDTKNKSKTRKRKEDQRREIHREFNQSFYLPLTSSLKHLPRSKLSLGSISTFNAFAKVIRQQQCRVKL